MTFLVDKIAICDASLKQDENEFVTRGFHDANLASEWEIRIAMAVGNAKLWSLV